MPLDRLSELFRVQCLVQGSCSRRWLRTEFEKDKEKMCLGATWQYGIFLTACKFITYSLTLCLLCWDNFLFWSFLLFLLFSLWTMSIWVSVKWLWMSISTLFLQLFVYFIILFPFSPFTCFLQMGFVLLPINHLIKILYTRVSIIYRKSFKHTCDLRRTVNIIQTTADFLANHVVADEDINPKSNNHSSILTWPPWKLALHSFLLIAHWTGCAER